MTSEKPPASEIPAVTIEGVEYLVFLDDQTANQDKTRPARVEDLAAVLAALPDQEQRRLLHIHSVHLFDEKLSDAESRAAKAESDLENAQHGHHGTRHELERVKRDLTAEREAHAVTREERNQMRDLYETACLVLERKANAS